MDSHFINFDGRSVHDMIELLLAASGDPEAIARLQQAIQTVDAKFGPVNTELERLEDDKQDTGNYITDNVDSTVANISKAMIGNVDSGYDIQINNTGEGNVDVDWLRFIFKGSSAKQIAATIRRNGTWETAARWTADEDTGWLTLQAGVQYRKKNGIVYVHVEFAQADIPSGGGSGWIGLNISNPLPTGFRPSIVIRNAMGFRLIADNQHKFTLGQINTSGGIQYNAFNTGPVDSTTHNTIVGDFCYPV